MTATLPSLTKAVPQRWVGVQADLLPDEIVESRRVKQLRKKLIIVLAALFVLLQLWFAFTKVQTAMARGDLRSAETERGRLLADQAKFAELTRTQTRIALTRAQVQKLMADDVQWAALLGDFRKALPAGVGLTNVSATLASSDAARKDAGAAALDRSGKKHVGNLTLSGTAKDRRSVAAYLDALAKVKGVTVPYPATVSVSEGSVKFTANVILTADALGGRFTPAGAK